MSQDTEKTPLAGYSVLVIEDEALIAIDLEEMLERAGAQIVGSISSLQAAMRQVRRDGFEVATVDLNLQGEPSLSVADALTESKIPFVFVSSYSTSSLPERYRTVPYIEKPFEEVAVIEAIVRAVDLGKCPT